MKTLDSVGAQEALFELMREHPELRTAHSADAAFETEALALLLAITANNWAAWQAAPVPVRDVAGTLLIDFFTKLVMNDPSFAKSRWLVRSSSKATQALEVIAHEIARNHPAQARPN